VSSIGHLLALPLPLSNRGRPVMASITCGGHHAPETLLATTGRGRATPLNPRYAALVRQAITPAAGGPRRSDRWPMKHVNFQPRHGLRQGHPRHDPKK